MQQGQLEKSSNWMEDFPLWVWLLESNLQLSFAKLGKTMQNPPVFGLNISQTMTIINHLTRKTFLQDWLNSPLQNLTLSWLINHFPWVFYGLVWGNINKPWILPQEQRWGNGGYFGFVWKLGTSKCRGLSSFSLFRQAHLTVCLAQLYIKCKIHLRASTSVYMFVDTHGTIGGMTANYLDDYLTTTVPGRP